MPRLWLGNTFTELWTNRGVRRERGGIRHLSASSVFSAVQHVTMKAILALEDGTIFEGQSLGVSGRAYGEVVFNTGMTGYQEILTDPSYAGQIVCLTYPLIGNYGVNEDDFESRKVQVEGFIVREAEELPSNWRSGKTLNRFLKEKGVVGIQKI